MMRDSNYVNVLMQHGILIIFLFLCGAAYCNPPDFAGVYKCKGFDPYTNGVYSGTVKIMPQNVVYKLEMDYDPGEKMMGTAGLYDENSLAVVFQDVKDLKKVGLGRYSYSADHKQIQGYWVYLGKDKLGKEVCVKQ